MLEASTSLQVIALLSTCRNCIQLHQLMIYSCCMLKYYELNGGTLICFHDLNVENRLHEQRSAKRSIDV